MNMVYKQMYALIFFVAVATTMPMRGMENDQVVTDASEQQIGDELLQGSSVVWYKKSSVQIAAVAMTTAAAIYALAVRMDKVSSPVAIAGMFFACAAKDVVTQSEQSSDKVSTEEVSVHVDTQNVFKEEANPTFINQIKDTLIVVQGVVVKTMNGISPFIIINERTPEPFDAINC